MLVALDFSIEVTDDGSNGSSGSQRCTISELIVLVTRDHAGCSKLLKVLSASSTVSETAQVVLSFSDYSFLLDSVSDLRRVSNPDVRLLAVHILLLKYESKISLAVNTYMCSGSTVAQG